MKDTKTHASRRIALDDATVPVLAAQRRRLEERAAACEVVLDPDGYVFTESADGTDQLHPDTSTGRFTRARKQAGLEGVGTIMICDTSTPSSCSPPEFQFAP